MIYLLLMWTHISLAASRTIPRFAVWSLVPPQIIWLPLGPSRTHSSTPIGGRIVKSPVFTLVYFVFGAIRGDTLGWLVMNLGAFAVAAFNRSIRTPSLRIHDAFQFRMTGDSGPCLVNVVNHFQPPLKAVAVSD